MGKLVLECVERKLKLKKLAAAVYTTLLQTANIKAEIVYSDSENMQSLNRSTRGVDKVTDVLSYPSLEGIRGIRLDPKECRTEMDGKYIFIGSVVLCEEKIREQAKEYGHSEREERDYLIVHGLMHLFGYDHETEGDRKLMRQKEKQALLILGKKERDREQKEIRGARIAESDKAAGFYRKEQEKKRKENLAAERKKEKDRIKAEKAAEKEKRAKEAELVVPEEEKANGDKT